MPTDITEDAIRAIALPLGFVDVKVCAVDAVWSGLKLVIRVSERAEHQFERAAGIAAAIVRSARPAGRGSASIAGVERQRGVVPRIARDIVEGDEVGIGRRRAAPGFGLHGFDEALDGAGMGVVVAGAEFGCRPRPHAAEEAGVATSDSTAKCTMSCGMMPCFGQSMIAVAPGGGDMSSRSNLPDAAPAFGEASVS